MKKNRNIAPKAVIAVSILFMMMLRPISLDMFRTKRSMYVSVKRENLPKFRINIGYNDLQKGKNLDKKEDLKFVPEDFDVKLKGINTLKIYRKYGKKSVHQKAEIEPEDKSDVKIFDTDFVKIEMRGEKMIERGIIDVKMGEVKGERVEKFVSKIINEIVEKIKFMISEEKKEALIKLRHDFFGGVEIRIKMVGDKVSMKVILANPHLKDALQSNIVELKSHLQNFGLDLNEFDIYYKESDRRAYKPRKFFNFGFDLETLPEKIEYEKVSVGEGFDVWA